MMKMLKNLLSRSREGTAPPVHANRLEELLAKAADNPADRGEFLRQLFHFEVFLLASPVKNQNGELDGFNLNTVTFDNEVTLLSFTSHEMVSQFFKKYNKAPERYVGMKTTALFQNAAQQNFGIMLNGGLDFGKHFKAQEVKEIISNSPAFAMSAFEKDTEMFIGQPNKGYPNGFITGIKSYLAKYHQVLDVYVGWVSLGGKKPEYLAVLEIGDRDPSSLEPFVVEDFVKALEGHLGGEGMTLLFAKDHYREMTKAQTLISVKKMP